MGKQKRSLDYRGGAAVRQIGPRVNKVSAKAAGAMWCDSKTKSPNLTVRDPIHCENVKLGIPFTPAIPAREGDVEIYINFCRESIKSRVLARVLTDTH
ncbi:hypothetical protein J6590_004553 [Homalodisca vitripennis]|nr:hypothetical protein J6590_004553 [Homalodisca vitripennis]